MRSFSLCVALLAAVSLSSVALANGHHGHHGHHGGGYVHHGHHAYGYGMPGYGAYGNGGHGVRTGYPGMTNGYANPYQALYLQQLMMQRAIMNNTRNNAGPGVWRP